MRTLLFAVAIAASLTACIDEPDVTSSSHGVESENRLAANRLAANRLAANRLAANRLAANSISSTKLSALEETASILQTKSGRQVYAYLMSCALSDTTTITKSDVYDCVDTNDDGVPDDVDNNGVPDDCSVLANDPAPTDPDDDPQFCVGGSCTFPGNLGLATAWANKKLSGAGEGWVSACMFARINKFETAEGISLRGDHPNLTPSVAERQAYPLQEAAFYGNMFARTGLDWNACQGRDQYEWLRDGDEVPGDEFGGSLYTRDCAEDAGGGTTECGLTYGGTCGSFDGSAAACRSEDGVDGFYSSCGSKGPYRQVITVFVANP